jgi:paraquat-inducible protein B
MIGAEPVIEKHRWLSPVWLLPFIALLLAGGFHLPAVDEQWSTHSHQLCPGQRYLAGQDPVALSGVAIGVQELELAQDGRKIAVLAKVDSRARPSYARAPTSGW